MLQLPTHKSSMVAKELLINMYDWSFWGCGENSQLGFVIIVGTAITELGDFNWNETVESAQKVVQVIVYGNLLKLWSLLCSKCNPVAFKANSKSINTFAHWLSVNILIHSLSFSQMNSNKCGCILVHEQSYHVSSWVMAQSLRCGPPPPCAPTWLKYKQTCTNARTQIHSEGWETHVLLP